MKPVAKTFALFVVLTCVVRAGQAQDLFFPGEPVPGSINMRSLWHAPDVVGGEIEFQKRAGRLYLFASSYGLGFRIFDITETHANGARPVLIGQYRARNTHYQNDIQLRGKVLVLAGDDDQQTGIGLEFVDITDLTNPQFLHFEQLESAHNATRVGDRLYVSGGKRMYVYDISDARRPEKLKEINVDVAGIVAARIYRDEGDPRFGWPAGYPLPPCNYEPNPAGEDETPHLFAPAGIDTTAVGQLLDPNTPCFKKLRFGAHNLDARVLDSNHHRLYVGAGERRGAYILDVELDSAATVKSVVRILPPLMEFDLRRSLVHAIDAIPFPDLSHLVIGDEPLTYGYNPPGPGLHIYDLGLGEAFPRKVGTYFLPALVGTAFSYPDQPRFLADRNVIVSGGVGSGVWVADLSGPTASMPAVIPEDPLLASTLGECCGGFGAEQQLTDWGRTLGHIPLPGAATFIAKSPGVSKDGKLRIYTGDWVRGVDVVEYYGPLPLPFPPGARKVVSAKTAVDEY